MAGKRKRKMSTPKTLKESFEKLPEPRMEKKTDHKLIDIVITAICAVIGGAESWTEIELFGQEKEQWLRRYLELPNRKAAIHMVSAWATEATLVLGQVKVDDKTNKITAIPELH